MNKQLLDILMPLYKSSKETNPFDHYSLPGLCSKLQLPDFQVYKCKEMLRGRLDIGVGNQLLALVIDYQENKRRSKVNIHQDYRYYHELGMNMIIKEPFCIFIKITMKVYTK